MDISVLERQRLVHQRLYQEIDHGNQQLLLSHSNWQQQPMNLLHPQSLPCSEIESKSSNHHHSNYSAVSNSNNSSMTRVCNTNSSFPNRQGKGSCSINKRKAEFDIEEEGGDKGFGSSEEEAGEEQSEITTKNERENSTNTCSKESSKVSEVQKPDYIHVRARRGQATDSHSLAERARREKISKKMKCLQDLVPGCNKVTGKAGMLDEIINYVQSLQKQVEFLSMKLAVSNPRLDFGIDNFFAKEIPAYIASLQEAATQLEANTLACLQYNPMHHGTFNIAMDQSQMLPKKEGSSVPEAFLDSSQSQQLPGWESDWTNQFNVGFH
ncbi:hypothetical protein ACJIZ3_002225 [Penstemon smallii]|uniref:BHLH domain-containing protein n=1 Tax=Penstemon smallii TaxID=265156 RepID=A0ABD3U924_9LAMI